MSDENQSSVPPTPDDFYRRLCENAAIAMMATDAEYRIVSWNPAAAELLGRRADEMLGKPIAQAVPRERRRLLERLLERTTRRGQTSQFEIRLDDADHRVRNLTVILSPIPGQADQPQGVAAWIVDETAAKKLNERLVQAEKMASLGTLAGGVAHHFNNILGGVATFVDFALTSGDPVAMKRALQMTTEAAARASRITQSLLSFAKADTQRADLADLTEIVLTFVHLVERPLAEKNIELRLDLHPAPITAVEANRMHQVLGNLLTNAEEAMPDGGIVSITISRTATDTVLTFADTGAGIGAEYLPLVFEPFFTTKGLLAGGDKVNPGLGLSVVHGIVIEMGGTISVFSELGRGTEFVISFPVTS